MNKKLRHAKAYGTGHSGFNPMSLSPAAWFKFNTGITVTGSGVSQWDDQSGNGRHLLQGTDANRPTKETDGVITFDGVDNFLKCNAFTLNQPETVYLLGKQVTWTSIDTIMDGNTVNTLRLFQTGTTPQVQINAGTGVATNANWTLNTYFPLAVVIDGANSLIHVNGSAATTGNAGAGNMGGFTLGAGGNSTAFAHIQIKEVIIYASAHSSTTRQQVFDYLSKI